MITVSADHRTTGEPCGSIAAYEARFDLILVAGSMGAPNALRQIVSELPAFFPAAVVMVQHRAVTGQDFTVEFLRRRAHATVQLAAAGDQLTGGTIYVTPADKQLVLDHMLTFVPAESAGSAADPLFRSAAEHLGPRALAVILSGMNADGAQGAAMIKHAGGRVLAQDRASARCFAMPAAAIATGCVDFVLPIDRMAQAIVTLTLMPGAADFFRVPLPPWARLGS